MPLRDEAKRAYLGELVNQLNAAILAIEAFNEAQARGNAMGMFGSLDDFLDHSARASQILWPVDESSQAKTRGEELCSILSVDDKSPLRKRTLRNHLQHFDERLDQWLQEHQYLVDSNIGPRNAFGLGLRYYISDEKVYVFRGEEFKIEPLVKAVDEILTAAKESYQKIAGHSYL